MPTSPESSPPTVMFFPKLTHDSSPRATSTSAHIAVPDKKDTGIHPIAEDAKSTECQPHSPAQPWVGVYTKHEWPHINRQPTTSHTMKRNEAAPRTSTQRQTARPPTAHPHPQHTVNPRCTRRTPHTLHLLVGAHQPRVKSSLLPRGDIKQSSTGEHNLRNPREDNYSESTLHFT